jgi:hypothetical protein
MRRETNTDDDAISVGRAIVEQLTSLNRNLASAIRTDAPGSFTEVAGDTVANFSVGLTADVVDIDLQITPAADADLYIRLSNVVGVFLNGATDYQYAFMRNAVSVASGGAPQAIVATNMQAGLQHQFNLRIWRGPEAVRHFALWKGIITDGTTGNTLASIDGGARFAANTLALNGIQFLLSGGVTISNYVAAVRYSDYG